MTPFGVFTGFLLVGVCHAQPGSNMWSECTQTTTTQPNNNVSFSCVKCSFVPTSTLNCFSHFSTSTCQLDPSQFRMCAVRMSHFILHVLFLSQLILHRMFCFFESRAKNNTDAAATTTNPVRIAVAFSLFVLCIVSIVLTHKNGLRDSNFLTVSVGLFFVDKIIDSCLSQATTTTNNNKKDNLITIVLAACLFATTAHSSFLSVYSTSALSVKFLPYFATIWTMLFFTLDFAHFAMRANNLVWASFVLAASILSFNFLSTTLLSFAFVILVLAKDKVQGKPMFVSILTFLCLVCVLMEIVFPLLLKCRDTDADTLKFWLLNTASPCANVTILRLSVLSIVSIARLYIGVLVFATDKQRNATVSPYLTPSTLVVVVRPITISPLDYSSAEEEEVDTVEFACSGTSAEEEDETSQQQKIIHFHV